MARDFGATTADVQIRASIEDWAKAMRAKNAAAVMAHYAADNVTFDLAPPLIQTAADAEGLRAWFANWQSPLGYQMRGLEITAGADVAFSHFLVGLSGTRTDGEKADLWFRQTLCFRKIGGDWRIAHQHESVPSTWTAAIAPESTCSREARRMSRKRLSPASAQKGLTDGGAHINESVN